MICDCIDHRFVQRFLKEPSIYLWIGINYLHFYLKRTILWKCFFNMGFFLHNHPVVLAYIIWLFWKSHRFSLLFFDLRYLESGWLWNWDKERIKENLIVWIEWRRRRWKKIRKIYKSEDHCIRRQSVYKIHVQRSDKKNHTEMLQRKNIRFKIRSMMNVFFLFNFMM